VDFHEFAVELRLLDRERGALRDELEERRAAIRVPALAEVADRYLEVLRG
jgi:hypothetical protein